MFVDKVQVMLKAGDGGNGVVNFRHEKFIDKGGPDGGDGGHGANIILQGSRNQNSLATFRYQKQLVAEDGGHGSKRKRHGKTGADMVVKIPVGTVIMAEDGTVLADLTADGQEFIIAKGGRGGFGNAHFVSSTRQAPRIAEKGEPGEQLTITMELKMLADVGLVGLPNAGKSTFLAAVSNAKPEIADYPFTTLRPNLGMVDINNTTSVLMADIPGLIEGASQGKGLGDEFLRHIERTSVLLHLVDVYNDNVAQAYQTIQAELKAYSTDLSKRPQIVALTKIDGVETAEINQKLVTLKKVVPKGTLLFAISAPSGKGMKELMFALQKMISKHRQQELAKPAALPIIKLVANDRWQVEATENGFLVHGGKIDSFAARTDFANRDAVQRLRDIMKRLGITKELIKQGVEADQLITFGKHGSIKF